MAKPVSPRGLARVRVLDAALVLFAQHGVHGTSLTMIAERVGVSKAAVYYQFRSKDDIVMELMRPTLDDIARVVRIAEALPDWEARRAVVISGLVELTVHHRRLAALLRGDPAINQMMAQRETRATVDRLRHMLEGPDPDPVSRIAASVFFAGVGNAAFDPTLANLEDAALHRALLELSNRIVTPSVERI